MSFEDKLLENQLKLNRFLAETDYKIKQVNGCRILEMPENINRSQIESGSEIFVTNLPELVFEDTLLPMFSSVGKVYKLRLMLCFSGANKGYCYVQYMNSEEASRAVAELNGVAIEDRYLSVKKSINNCRLFFQNLPVEVSREEIEREFRAALPEAMNIFVFADPKDPHKNRGFIFVEFETHRSAALARRKYCKGLKMFDRNIIVGWAVPEKQMDDVSQATDLFIRCIPPDVFENDIRKEIEKYLIPKPFFKVKKIKDFGFIHFDDHKNAEKVLKITRKGKSYSISSLL
ncbi:putative RNA-binding protein 46 [Lycorma delicatula]|uniref:putative RNA-binding protein 46 n=1 Tax=Lycorma delicatula TaxID=130591 RepID=UPI003F51A937